MTSEDLARHQQGARHKKNLKILNELCGMVVCEEVGEYRAAATQLVSSQDNVLEIGCHEGATTKVIAQQTANLIGLDQKEMLVQRARVHLPDVQFEVGDAFDAQRIMALAKSCNPPRFHKVFIDISGSRDLSTVVRLLDMYENVLRPDQMIVKSQLLKRLLMRGQLWVDHESNSML